jgi:hypothetical protein
MVLLLLEPFARITSKTRAIELPAAATGSFLHLPQEHVVQLQPGMGEVGKWKLSTSVIFDRRLDGN